MKHIRTIILILIIASCGNKGSNQQDLVKTNSDDSDTTTNNAAVAAPLTSGYSCYENVSGKDTVLLSLSREADIITGSLTYNYYEKDKNRGKIRGNMHGDTLIADYVFMSEGKPSVRQVAFLKQGNSFIEGYGDATEENGKMIFKNRTLLNFIGKPLVAIDCDRQ